MLTQSKRLFEQSTVLGVLCLVIAALIAPSAHAVIEEIVVTAQKREESVQDVPISVSAFDNSTLEERQIDTFSLISDNGPAAFAGCRYPGIFYRKANQPAACRRCYLPHAFQAVTRLRRANRL